MSTSAISDVRQFNRFYTRHIGVLQEKHLESEFSLAEVRVMRELNARNTTTASELAADLDLDGGYLSRLLRSLARRKLVTRKRDTVDGRQRLLMLTPTGRQAFAGLDQKANDAISSIIQHLSPRQQHDLVEALQTVQRLLQPSPASSASVHSSSQASVASLPAPFVLRTPSSGDLGWVLYRHGVLYAKEYGWDWRFEGLVAGILAEFVANFKPGREQCWIAERNGEIVGSVFAVQKSESVAKLRLLYVEPSTRGLGLGRELVRECVRFCRKVGYQKLTLWTQSVLTSARKIYAAEGFVLVDTQINNDFGGNLAETWELTF